MASPRILLIRTSALGDVIHALPVLRALRENLPKASIGWLVEEAYAPLLASHSDLDEVIPVNLRSWRQRPFSSQTWGDIRRFVRQLGEFSADVALDLMGNHKAGVLAALSMADRRVGLERSFRREPSSAMWIGESIHPVGEHAVDRMISLVGALGVPATQVDFGPQQLLQALGLPSYGQVDSTDGEILIHPGAGWANKRYPPTRWGQVAKRIADQTGLRSRVLSTPAEEDLAREVEEASDGTATRLSAPGLPDLAAELNRARLVMGGDTGPIHLAHALGRPVLCLLGPTDPERNGPYGAELSAIWHQLPCSFCYKRFDETKLCLLELSAEEVAGRAGQILAKNTLSRLGNASE